MDYQEKLRLAKKALDSGSYDKETIEYIFPELKKSDDEKIRKEIIEFCKTNLPYASPWIAWLEKQGLQKQRKEWSADDVWNYNQIMDILEEYNRTELMDWLEKQCEQKTVSKTEPIIEGLTTEFQKQVSHLIASVMDKEHEYDEDFVKWTANALLNYAKQELEKQGEQKPTEWSDRDWYYYSKLESFLEVKDHYSPTESSSGYQKDVYETLIWLKSLRPNKYVTWSEEDERYYDSTLWHIKNSCGKEGNVYNWLKSLKKRLKGE